MKTNIKNTQNMKQNCKYMSRYYKMIVIVNFWDGKTFATSAQKKGVCLI